MTIDMERLCNLAQTLETKHKKVTTNSNARWFDIRNMGTTTEIYLYDNIGQFGITARDFVREIQTITTDEIELHVASNGGEVFDGVAIWTALKNHKAKVTAYIDSVAASAASFIIMAANEIVMEPMSRLMIHDASGGCMGNAKDMREVADLLEQISDTIADAYSDRAGGDRKSWRKKMATDTWFDAQEAVKAGLADRVAGQDNTRNSSSARIVSNEDETPVVAVDAGLLFNFIKEGIK